jgi:hypothetical protein
MTTNKTPRPAFDLDETDSFEVLGGGKVRFTAWCGHQPGVVGRLGQYEITVEASERGVYSADPLHGWTEETLALPRSQQKPVELTDAESVELERWALFCEPVRKVASDYFDGIAEERAEDRAEAAHASL